MSLLYPPDAGRADLCDFFGVELLSGFLRCESFDARVTDCLFCDFDFAAL